MSKITLEEEKEEYFGIGVKEFKKILQNASDKSQIEQLNMFEKSVRNSTLDEVKEAVEKMKEEVYIQVGFSCKMYKSGEFSNPKRLPEKITVLINKPDLLALIDKLRK